MLTLSGWPRPTLTAHISHSALFQVAAYARLLNFNPGKGGQLRKEKHVRDCAGGLLGRSWPAGDGRLRRPPSAHCQHPLWE